jgi:hypothetical protein
MASGPAAVVMAGLVPAIHVLQYLGTARGCIYIQSRPNGILMSAWRTILSDVCLNTALALLRVLPNAMD